MSGDKTERITAQTNESAMTLRHLSFRQRRNFHSGHNFTQQHAKDGVTGRLRLIAQSRRDHARNAIDCDFSTVTACVHGIHVVNWNTVFELLESLRYISILVGVHICTFGKSLPCAPLSPKLLPFCFSRGMSMLGRDRMYVSGVESGIVVWRRVITVSSWKRCIRSSPS